MMREQLEILSNQDGLTALSNRRFFDNLIEEEWSRGRDCFVIKNLY